MAKNKNMHKAKKVKNDEFYTRIQDIEKEMRYYEDQFKDKVIFCNCDDPEESHFWKYFYLKFNHLGFKKLISTHYEKNKPTYKLEITRYEGMEGNVKDEDVIRTNLKQNGDFKSDECIELLKEADIVVTNPPFSLFKEYIAQLMEYDKKFLIIGSQNAITYKETFKFINDNRMWLGYTSPKEFLQPDGTIKKFGNISWFTNLEIKKRNEELFLFKEYNEKDYPKYDNYDAIEVGKVKDIPKDYAGVMGVPITFLGKHNPDQFEMKGSRRYFYDESLGITNGKTLINGNEKYDRIFIKNKQLN